MDSVSWVSGLSPVFGVEYCSDDGIALEDRDPEEGDLHGVPTPLVDQCCKILGTSLPFEEVIQLSPGPLPDNVQQRIAFWSFPRDERKIRLFASLGNHSMHVFSEAEQLLRKGRLQKMYQIGFQLCAKFVYDVKGQHKAQQNIQTSVTFDRGCITKSYCTCGALTSWCAHVVATCLSRARYPHRAEIRVPLSSTLMHLDRAQLQKFAQYLIMSSSGNLMFSAQELLDEFTFYGSEVNTCPGAPDDTIGGGIGEPCKWLLSAPTLEAILRDQNSSILSEITFLSSPEYITTPQAVNCFQKMMFYAVNYTKFPVFRIDYCTIVTRLLNEGDSNALVVLRAASRALPEILGHRPFNDVLMYSLVNDLSTLWMLAGLAFSGDNSMANQIATSLTELRSKLSHSMSEMLDKPLDFVLCCLEASHCTLSSSDAVSESMEGATHDSQEEKTSQKEVESIIVSTSFIEFVRQHLESISSPLLSTSLNLRVFMDACPQALTAILKYCEVLGKQNVSLELPEAVTTWLFPENTAAVREHTSRAHSFSQLNPFLHSTDYLVLLQLSLFLLQQRKSSCTVSFALRTLLLPFELHKTEPALEVLAVSYEKHILDAIQEYLDDDQHMITESLTTLAKEGAEYLLRLPSQEEYLETPPYIAACVVYSILTHQRPADDTLFQLGHILALHVIEAFPITKLNHSSQDTANFNHATAHMIRQCMWARLESLLLKVLATSDVYYAKEVTSTLESVFPEPLNFPIPPALANELTSKHATDESTRLEMIPSLQTLSATRSKDLHVSTVDVFMLQSVVSSLTKTSKRPPGVENLALFELYLLSLKASNCVCHWVSMQEEAEIVSKLSVLAIRVGEPALLVLYHKWPVCLTSSSVVITVQELLKQSPKAFPSAAVCQLLKKVLRSAEHMHCDSIQQAFEICCKSGLKHAIEAADLLLQTPLISSEVFFMLAHSLYELHLQYKTKELSKTERSQSMRVTCQQEAMSESWEEEDDGNANVVMPGSSSLLGSPPSLLGPPSQKLLHASPTDPQLTVQQYCANTSQSLEWHLHSNHHHRPTSLSQKCLRKAFQVGMHAMEVMTAERSEAVWDSRELELLSGNECASGVKTVTNIACAMGNVQIQTLVQILPSAISSPRILHHTAVSIAHHLSRSHRHQVEIQLRNEPLTSILREAMRWFGRYVEVQIAASGKRCCRKDTIGLLKDMKVTAQYLPNGQEEFSRFLYTLLQAQGHKNKKLRRAIVENFQEHMSPNVTNVHETGNQAFPFSMTGEVWD